MRLFLTRVCGRLAVAGTVLTLPSAGAAQTLTTGGTAVAQAPAATQKPPAAPAPPATQKPPAAPAPPATQNPPAPNTPAAAPPAAADALLAEDSLSLFTPRWNMFELSGRVSSVDGDPARWQRYQDLRDGLLFTEVRALQETADWNGSVTADNVGWRDQRFSGNYERIGVFRVSGL